MVIELKCIKFAPPMSLIKVNSETLTLVTVASTGSSNVTINLRRSTNRLKAIMVGDTESRINKDVINALLCTITWLDSGMGLTRSLTTVPVIDKYVVKASVANNCVFLMLEKSFSRRLIVIM